VQCVCGAVDFSGPMVHRWNDRQYILSNGGVTNGKAKLKTCMATPDVTDGPLAVALELSP
jgi:hypothetical protein